MACSSISTVLPAASAMAPPVDLLPSGQFGIGWAQLAVGLRLEPRDLVGDVEIAAAGEMPQGLDLALQLGDRFFEVEEMAHCGAFPSTALDKRPLLRGGLHRRAGREIDPRPPHRSGAAASPACRRAAWR